MDLRGTVTAALCIEEDTERSFRLKLAARVDHNLHITLARSLAEAKRLLSESGPSFPIIFIAPSFPQAEVRSFITEAKNLPGGQVSAYVLVCAAHETSAQNISSKLAAGFDGFLREPFSVDQMREVIELAERLTQQRAEERFEMAIQVAFVDVLKFLRDPSGDPATKSSSLDARHVRLLRDTLRSLYEVNPERFHEVVVESFIRLAARRDQKGSGAYHGASERVRKRLARRPADGDLGPGIPEFSTSKPGEEDD